MHKLVGCSCRTCSPYLMFSFDPRGSTILPTAVSMEGWTLPTSLCMAVLFHGTTELGNCPF